MPGYRQEVFNVLLAQLLYKRGVISAPENIVKSNLTQGRRMPDVIVSFNGLRTAIEGEVGDHADAPTLALESARGRVEEGIAHIGIAAVYPEHLRQVEFGALEAELAQGDERETLLVAQINLDLVDEARAQVPVFRDRRAEVYGRWR